MTEFASCCILSYNRPNFLRDCISTLLQTAEYPLELIVHDDGSSDPGLRKYLRELVDGGVISTLITNPPGHNQGQGIALNRMFHMAKGDPIVKIDHDLIFQKGWLKQSVTTLNANRERLAEPRLGCLGLFHYGPIDHEVSSDRTFIKAHEGWEEHRDFVGSCMVIPRNAWETFGPFEERSEAFAEDAIFKQQVSEAYGWACGLLPQDMVRNQGFGLGPSTVVAQKENGDLTSASIKTTPFILDMQKDMGGS